MKLGDSLPDKICSKCVTIVNNAAQFRKTCRSSNAYLQSVLQRTKSASTLFKPSVPTCQSSDEEVDDDKVTTDASTIIENELEHDINVEKQKDILMEGEQFETLDSLNIETEKNLEQTKIKVEEVFTDISDNTLELEGIIEISQEMEDQMLSQEIENYTKEDNTEDSNINKSETSQLQKFYMNASFSKIKNIEDEPDNSEADTDNFKLNKVELCILHNEDSNSKDDHENMEEHEDHHSVTDEDVKCVDIGEVVKMEADIDESIMIQLEEEINDNENQPQVSSTVDTSDEIEYEHNSNTSDLTNSLYEECLLDEHFSSCDISSNEETSDANSHTIKTDRKERGRKVKIYVCKICENQFSNRNSIKKHLKVHSQERNHQCELCLKRFLTACNLQAHMRVHTGEKPFVCKYCDRRFSDRSSHIRHERVHTNEKPFECAYCAKCFALSTTLQNHLKVHTNERSYRCEPCGKSFKLAHHLKTHKNTSLHRSRLQTEVNEN